jgi:hypothetical protein
MKKIFALLVVLIGVEVGLTLNAHSTACEATRRLNGKCRFEVYNGKVHYFCGSPSFYEKPNCTIYVAQ